MRRRLSDMSLAVARMQKEVSAVRAENDHALKIQGMEDRRKIQMLLVMTEPVANRVAEPGSIRLYNSAVATARRKNTGSLSIDIAPGLLSPPSSTPYWPRTGQAATARSCSTPSAETYLKLRRS